MMTMNDMNIHGIHRIRTGTRNMIQCFDDRLDLENK